MVSLGGLDALSMIRVHEQEQHLPPSRIAVVSVSEDEAKIRDCYAAGADAYYVKPIKPEDLRTLLVEGE